MIGAIIGDSDTLAAITGALAEARWGAPDALRDEALDRLDDFLLDALASFESRCPPL